MVDDCKSLADLMDEAFDLSLDLMYETVAPGGHFFDPRKGRWGTDDEEDKVCSWADGLMHKYYQNLSTGHCSIGAMARFDVAKFEDEVICDIDMMKRLLAQCGPPLAPGHLVPEPAPPCVIARGPIPRLGARFYPGTLSTVKALRAREDTFFGGTPSS